LFLSLGPTTPLKLNFKQKINFNLKFWCIPTAGRTNLILMEFSRTGNYLWMHYSF
jgi:hypothetical protein